MPAIYTAYFALLPFWPNEAPMPLYPYTPKDVYPGAAERYSPRALLMLGLVVRLLNVQSQFVYSNVFVDRLDVPVCPCLFNQCEPGLVD